MNDRMQEVFDMSGGPRHTEEPVELKEAHAVPTYWWKTDMAVSNLISVIWALLFICCPAIVIAVYRFVLFG